MVKAIETCFPGLAPQRCLAHCMHNLAANVPDDRSPKFNGQATAACKTPSSAIARELAGGVVTDPAKGFPSATRCFEDNFEACIGYLRMLMNHRRASQITNFDPRQMVAVRDNLDAEHRAQVGPADTPSTSDRSDHMASSSRT